MVLRRIDLQKLADRKIESAQVLAENKHWSNSYYLAGYSVEMALKAIIAKQISADTLPDKSLINKVYTHDINQLLGLAGLRSEHTALVSQDSLFGANWSICSEWSPESRYEERSAAEAHFLIVAVTQANHGVLPWIRNYW